MKLTVCALAGALLLTSGAGMPAAAAPQPQPVSSTTLVIRSNFVDRLLQGDTKRRARSHPHKRKLNSDKGKTQAVESQVSGTVPIPLPKPEGENAGEAPAPKPLERPPQSKPDPTPAPPDPKPEEDKKDAPRPDLKEPEAKPDAAPKDAPAPQEPPPDAAESQPDPVHEDAGALKACLAELDTLGAKYAKADPIDEGNGCGIEQPIKVDAVLPGLSLGGAVMRCQTAVSLAHWLKNTVQPAIEVTKPGRKLVGIVPGSTFACRLRNNASTGMISEHARGNAFDVAAFKFDNGETIEMKPRQDDHSMEGAFQKATAAGACLYFTTVLAPGSDASHETHMHVDVKDRKDGYRICEGD